ncbi:mucin-17 isoform X2 [Folsomia candida]|uniref:mucin-17 isoform X2 n=1 Tax=Folsomia candida TaxID=158441 RepID=UPI001605119E|nr:mucin-17 isoform X2 [Folsomia candida]
MTLLSSAGGRRGPHFFSFLLFHTLLLTQIYSTLADPKLQDASLSSCATNEFRCDCGVPKCVDKSLVKNGVKDCEDGSDEGEWDPSKCAIKNRTSEDIRFKRAAIPEFGGGDATTTFFTNERARTRPVGLLSTSLGAFVTSGTTTEYLTKVLGTYIKGTYARIVSTSSKVYHAVPTEQAGGGGEVRPTGFIASTTSTEINGYATTVHSTEFYRTYIDGTYAQIVSSTSNVKYPSWYTDRIEGIEPTAVDQLVGKVYSTALLPAEVRGSFVAPKNNVISSKAYAEVGIVSEDEANPGSLKLLRPNNNAANELKVTGTHGKFVHADQDRGDETTYNVFTGSYVQNSKTFLFFFGNTVIDATKAGLGNTSPATLTVESGRRPGNSVMVDMSKNLRVVVPSSNSRVKVDGSIGGERMSGVLVEIEGSEIGGDEFISVDGAQEVEGTPTVDMITMTLGDTTQERVSSSSSSSSTGNKNNNDNENEIPQGRKVPDSLIAPSRAAEQLSLPTFTVGQPDMVGLEQEVTTPHVADMLVDSSTKNPVRVAQAPVFLKTTERAPPARSTDRIRALGYTQKKTSSSSVGGANLNGRYPMPNRSHRAFSGFDAEKTASDSDNDLAGAASTGRATVTYVGFADFTTTVGNTVIVFMPRTKMIEDLSVHATKTRNEPSSQQIEPTRYVYHTGNGDETTTTTEGSRDEDHIQFSVSQVQGRKVLDDKKKASSSSKRVTFRDEEDEETTTEINPTSEISGRETIILGSSKSSGGHQIPKVRPSSTSSLSDKRNSLFSTPRAKFTPKSKEASSSSASPSFTSSSGKSGPYQTAVTSVFQTDILNPTGLVTSVDGTIVRDGKTTLYTSLVYGTFIGKSYAQVIKSTSRVVKAAVSSSVLPTRSTIRPTSVAKLPKSSPKSVAPIYYEFSTTTQSSTDNGDDVETTTAGNDVDRMEVTVSSTTPRSKEVDDDIDDDLPTTTVRLEDSFDDDDITTTTEFSEAENEIGRKRKVAGNAKDQIIVDLEASPVPSGQDEQDQTVYVTRTLPTTVFRTWTYFTTFFIPEEGSTSTKIVSREVTSSAVGLVRKTFTNLVVPTSSSTLEDDEEATKPSAVVTKPKRIRGKDGGAQAQVIYKTLFTTYTYLTTFFSGQTSSVASREETVSNIVTVTSSQGIALTKSFATDSTITPTSSSSTVARSRYKTIAPRLSSTNSINTPNLGASSSSIRTRGRASTILRQKVVPSSSTTEEVDDDNRATDEIEYQSVTKTLLRTFFTTFTFVTTLFGEDTSIKSRTEIITNVVPYVTKTLAPITPSSVPTAPPISDEYDEGEESISASSSFKMSNNPKSKVKETTFYTTYTYLSSIFKGKTSTVKTSKQTYTNILVADATIRSGYVEPIAPTQLSGRSVSSASSATTRTPKFVTNEIDSVDADVTVTTQNPDQYELEGSEDIGITTTRPDSYDDKDDDDVNDVIAKSKTPLLKTLYTTYSFYTTYYKGGSSTVSSRLETKSQVVTDTAGLGDDEDDEVSVKAPLLSTIDPIYPVTYFTTLTYWTTSFKDGNSIVTSREETVTNVVTPDPGASLSPSSTEVNEIVPTSSAAQEVELTTFFTTYTYFTSSYLGEKTVINSRLETVTNVITGTVSPTSTQTARAIGGTAKPGEQKVTGNDKDEYEDYATGLLSTIVSTSVHDGTTTLYSTDVFGTLIDGIYAQVLESTSKVVTPTLASAFTRFFPEASESVTGVVSVNEGKTVEAGKDRTTFFATTAYGTVIDGQYAHLVESTSSQKGNAKTDDAAQFQKTGLVRVIDGTLVEGDHTTFYTSSILGTFVDGQYAQVIESTSRFIINPTKTEDGLVSKTVFVDVESSVTESSSSQNNDDDDEAVTTTTEKDKSSSEEVTTKKLGIVPPRPRFGSGNRASSSRLSFTGSSKVAPTITPFASRSRPSGFTPRKRTSTPVIVASKTEDASSSSSPSTSVLSRGGFQAKRRFQKPGGDSNNVNADGTTTPTPALPASRSRGNGRFTKPVVGGKSRFDKSNSAASASSASISPSSASGGTGSSGGSFSKSRSTFAPRGSSVAGGGRSRTSVPGGIRATSSLGGVRSGASSSSRFVPGGRGRASSSAINPTATQTSTVTPTLLSSPAVSEYTDTEYEYTDGGSSSTVSTTSSTTESPRSRYGGGGNRFRLSNKLSTPTATGTTTSRPTTRGSPLNLRRFSKPTIPTRGTTTPAPVTSSTAEGGDDTSISKPTNDQEYTLENEYDVESPSTSTTTTTSTTKPIGGRAPFGSRKPLTASSAPRPTSRPAPVPANRGRAAATTSAPVAQTTTRRIYTPRPRPAGSLFPKAVGPLARTTTTVSPAHADEEYYEEGEFEYQESKNLPNPDQLVLNAGSSNATVTTQQVAAGSELSPMRVQAPPDMVSDIFGVHPSSSVGLQEEDDAAASLLSRRRKRSPNSRL